MDIRSLLAYSDNSRDLLRETLAAHPEALNTPIETISAYKSIGQLVAHMIGAEQRWTIQRLYAEPRPLRYEETPADTLDGLFADWDTIRARTRAFVEAASEPALQQRIAFSLPNWNNYEETLTAEQILFHIFNHQNFHTAQISMALQQGGIDAPNFDYIFLHRAGYTHS